MQNTRNDIKSEYLKYLQKIQDLKLKKLGILVRARKSIDQRKLAELKEHIKKIYG